MKKLVSIWLIIASLGVYAKAENTSDSATVNEVWDLVNSDRYLILPQQKISLKSLVSWGVNKIEIAAKRTVKDRSDILPYFRKLAHPNGACMLGTWNITESTKYSGYFKEGTSAPIIVRASTALSETTVGKYRGFGLAGKIFPKNDQDKFSSTANFFLIDDLAGTKAKHYTDVEMTNEPSVTINSYALKKLFYALKLAAAFRKADPNPGMRQVYEISEMGESDPSKVVNPHRMMVKAQAGQTVDEADFRDELNIKNRANNLKFDIYISDNRESKPKKITWSKIGFIELVNSVASSSCDHRLHFHHPKWKTNR
jgi:hypothetical protein